MTPTERNAVLEEAARLADNNVLYHRVSAKDAHNSDAYALAWEHQRAEESCLGVAAAIRALKEQEPTT